MLLGGISLAFLAPATRTSALARCRAVSIMREATLPTDLLSAIATEPVVIYSKSWCPFCSDCKALFDQMQQPYLAIELDQREDGDELQAALLSLTAQRTVPNVFVGGRHLGGNDETQEAARTGRLAELLVAASSEPMGRIVPTRAISATQLELEEPSTTVRSDPVSTVFKLLFAPGKRRKIAWGVLQLPIDPAAVPSDEERARRRADAAKQLVNIDMEERQRRKMAGLAMAAISTAVGAALLTAHAPAASRLAIAPPLFLSIGYLGSWREGL